jgi:hypothetical protein
MKTRKTIAMSKLEITRGEYRFAEQDLHTYIHIGGKHLCSFVRRDEDEDKIKAIGELFCNAGNTYQLTGLLPSQMDELLKQKRSVEKQRDELLESSRKILTWIKAHPRKATIVQHVIDEFESAIKNAEK